MRNLIMGLVGLVLMIGGCTYNVHLEEYNKRVISEHVVTCEPVDVFFISKTDSCEGTVQVDGELVMFTSDYETAREVYKAMLNQTTVQMPTHYIGQPVDTSDPIWARIILIWGIGLAVFASLAELFEH